MSTRAPEQTSAQRRRVASTTWLAGQVYGKSIVYGKSMVYGASGSRVRWPNTCCFHCYYTDIAVDRTPYSRYRAAATLLKLINYGHFGRGRSSQRSRGSRGSSSRWRRCISSINAIKACKEAESKDASHLPVRTKPPKMKLLKRSERDTYRKRERRERERLRDETTGQQQLHWSWLQELTILPLCAAIDLSYPQKPTK